MNIVPNHVYSKYSLLYSINRIDHLVKKAKALGYESLALSDLHVMYGIVPFYKTCIAHGIKPIIGLEVSVQYEEERVGRVRLFAKNNEGYTNLLQLSTLLLHKKAQEVFITKAELLAYQSNVQIVIPYENGPLYLWIEDGNDEKAHAWVKKWLKNASLSDVFIAITNGKKRNQYERLKKFSAKCGIRMIASYPCYFVEPKEKKAFQIARAIKSGKSIAERPYPENSDTFYLHSKQEMKERFIYEPEALANTALLAKNTVQLSLDTMRLPKFTLKENADEKLRTLCEEGLYERYGKVTVQMKERLHNELTVISQMGFSDYFLIVWDFMRYARKENILTGPGRGSAAGSLVAYVLQITQVDPLAYDLLFERFLNIERISMPDIDIDFPDDRREEVIEYVYEKYGKDHVAQIATFGTLAARAVIRDVGKALNISPTTIERVAKAIPSRPGMTLDRARIENNTLQTILSNSEEVAFMWELATQLEGLPKHISTHAAGVVISAQPLTEIVALQAGQGKIPLTQASMDTVEQLGLLKFDFLGLKNLTLLQQMCHMIKVNYGISLNLNELPTADKKTFALLKAGKTTGVFQLESEGMRRVLTTLGPTEFEDIVAVNALYRPGPMEFIKTYIDGKYNRRPITYVHPHVKPILQKTYGVIVYQEQIMQIVSTLAGYSLAEADLLRRAISKKNSTVLEQQRKVFIRRAMKKGYDKKIATEIFSLIARFANYGFNRSHAVAYSKIAYQLAYIKAHYPLVFYTALLSNVWHDDKKLVSYIQQCKKIGFTILQPSISKSDALFTIEEGAIRVGLLSIRHVGKQAIEAIIKERKEKPFQDYFNFVMRMYKKAVTKKTIEQLIKAGALDEFKQDRATLLYSLDTAIQFAKEILEFKEESAGLFTLDVQPPQYEKIEPLHLHERLAVEKEVLGFYVSGHPLEAYKNELAKTRRILVHKAKKTTGYVQVAGLITELKKITTKKGDRMAFATVNDETAHIDAVIFPQVFQREQSKLVVGALLLIEGRMDFSRNKAQLIIEKITTLKKSRTNSDASQTLFLRIVPANEKANVLKKVKEILEHHRGTTEVALYYEKTKKLIKLSTAYAVSPNSLFMTRLEKLLGRDNVVLRENKK